MFMPPSVSSIREQGARACASSLGPDFNEKRAYRAMT